MAGFMGRGADIQVVDLRSLVYALTVSTALLCILCAVTKQCAGVCLDCFCKLHKGVKWLVLVLFFSASGNLPLSPSLPLYLSLFLSLFLVLSIFLALNALI